MIATATNSGLQKSLRIQRQTRLLLVEGKDEVNLLREAHQGLSQGRWSRTYR